MLLGACNPMFHPITSLDLDFVHYFFSGGPSGLRLTFVGELGYELHCPREAALDVGQLRHHFGTVSRAFRSPRPPSSAEWGSTHSAYSEWALIGRWMGC